MASAAVTAALSAELDTAELDGATNHVTVEQDGSANFTISLSASGSVACGSSHTAKVNTAYSVDSAGAVSSNTLSAAKTFTAAPAPSCSGTNGPITWSGAPTPQTVSASVSADAAAPLGDHTIVLKASNGNVALTDSNTSGGKLADDTGTTLTIHVVAPTPPANSAPSVLFDSPPTSADEGDTKTFNFSVSDADSGDTFSVASSYPDCGTGGTLVAGSLSTTASGGSFQCEFSDGPASPTVSIQVKDGSNAVSNIATAPLGVANVAPTVVLSGADNANEGDTKTYTYTISDPGVDPNPTVTESCGDNGARTDTAAANSFDCTFPDGPSSSTVKVTADDGDPSNNVGDDEIVVSIANVAPTVVLSGADNANEGDTKTYTYTISDPGVDPNPTVTESCGDNGARTDTAAANSFDCTFPDGPSSSTVKVTADDGDPSNNVGDDEIVVSIANVAPTVGSLTVGGATGTACIGGSNSVTLDFSFSDPGVNDGWDVDIDWGDGSTTTYSTSSQGAQTQQSHTYSGAGSHQITVTVTDNVGESGSSDSSQGSVSFLYNMTGILPPFNADGTSIWKYGSTLPVKVKITDCNGTPVAGLRPQVGTSKQSSLTPVTGIDETASTSAADTTGVMRYDSTAGQYIYNFASKNLADGNATYYMYVRGKDAAGNLVTNPSQVNQKFGLRTK